jgi:hypothetical protein
MCGERTRRNEMTREEVMGLLDSRADEAKVDMEKKMEAASAAEALAEFAQERWVEAVAAHDAMAALYEKEARGKAKPGAKLDRDIEPPNRELPEPGEPQA